MEKQRTKTKNKKQIACHESSPIYQSSHQMSSIQSCDPCVLIQMRLKAVLLKSSIGQYQINVKDDKALQLKRSSSSN